jgi:UDP-3-O-[3-hydroxymyristoyl] N-acetylglucosamine deacetylase
MIEVQRTIAQPGELRGLGLQTGREIHVTFKPAPPETGIVFRVLSSENEWHTIKGSLENLVGVNHSTILGSDGCELHTVEHVLAAFWGLNIDNIYVEVRGEEMPIMDGSCHQFVEFIQNLGIKLQAADRRMIKIIKECYVGSRDRYIHARPSDMFRLDYKILFDHPAIQCQQYTLNSDLNAFFTEVAPARTFGFLSEIKKLRKMGYLKGGSLQNAIVVGRKRVLNPGLRFQNEFVRHKVLDALGDFYLLGHSLIGSIEVYRGGHSLHAQFIKQLIEDPTSWCWVPENRTESVELTDEVAVENYSIS